MVFEDLEIFHGKNALLKLCKFIKKSYDAFMAKD